MVTLNDTVRLVAMQFSFLNPVLVPASVKRLNRETQGEHMERKSHSSGVMVIEPTEKCSLVEFLGELEAAGYEMVDALYKERINYKDPSGKSTYHMVRFLFARREFAGFSDEFKKAHDDIRTAFVEMCRVAMWRVRAFSNPFYKNGEEIAGQRAVSVNLELPLASWRQVKTDHCLRIVDDAITIEFLKSAK